MTRPPSGNPWIDAAKVRDAMAYAFDLHLDDRRKGGDIPYFAHLLEVAATVANHGGDDDQIAAAFLHDTAEDHGGHRQLVEIADRFGVRVAHIVEVMSDSLADVDSGESKLPWAERKAAYVAAMGHPSAEDAWLVCAADKLANARSIALDHARLGPSLWDRFSESDPAAQIWYLRALADLLGEHLGGPVAAELDEIVWNLESAVAAETDGLAERIRTVDEQMRELMSTT